MVDEAAVSARHGHQQRRRVPRAAAGARAGAPRSAPTEVEVINDSELIAHQVNGRYKVKHPDMKPLHAEALRALGGFERWSIRPVPRAQNADADALVNQALDGELA